MPSSAAPNSGPNSGIDSAGSAGDDVPADFEPVLVGDDPPDGEPPNAPPFGDRVLPLPLSPAALSDRATDGGPPKDGIPSIDDPKFIEAGDTESPEDDATVLGVVGDDEAKAYPRRVLVQHEIVNDHLDGAPVAVTYCPLTGTAQGFRRGDTGFGVSGMLINNNLIMYDRELDRWWPQIPAVSIPGPWSDTPGGATLREFDVIRTTWGAWRDRYPDTVVLSEATGYARNYDRDPYGARGYYQNDNTIFGNLHESDRYHSKRWVYGVRNEEGVAAFLANSVRESGVVNGAVGDVPYVAVYDPGLDTGIVYRNPDGASFEFEDGWVRDENGDEHSPEDLPLQRALSFDAFWFGWFAYYPHTAVYE